MAKSNVRYVLTGPRAGQDFVPRNQPGVVFTEGVFETAVENDQIPGLSRVLASYGAYQEHEIPAELREEAPAAKPKKGGKSNAKKTSTSKPASTGKTAAKTPAAGNDAAGTEAGTEGQGAAGTDGAGTDGTQTAGSDLV